MLFFKAIFLYNMKDTIKSTKTGKATLKMILSCQNITKAFNEKMILNQVSFHIEDYDKRIHHVKTMEHEDLVVSLFPFLLC